MRILLLGAGTSGRMLASRLCAEQHDVVLVDRDPVALEQVEAQMDLLTIQGDAADPSILEVAGIGRTDLVVALTDQESVNILACSLAHISGVPRKVARVSSNAYTGANGNFDLRELGIDLIINQQHECAKELFNILRIPGAQEAVGLLEDRVLCVGVQIPTDCPLLAGALKESPYHEILSTIRFVAYMRGGKLKIPRGETAFAIGDIVYLVGDPEKVRAFLKFLLPGEEGYSRVVIAGGGQLGLQLARRLEKDSQFNVTLLESEAERADYCSEELERTLILHGSSLDQDMMAELGINGQTSFVAVTGDDENNIMSCLVAEKLGAHFTISRVDKATYQPIIDSLALVDRVISPHSSLINSIYHFVRGSSVMGDRILQKIPGEVVDFLIGEEHKWNGKKVMNIKLPKGCLLSMILRDTNLIVATGDLKLETGDRILLYGLPKAIRRIEDLLS
ncbi:Trk system potassium transporter TrkA [Kiritimatiellaeota bacterium B1221]|nr:Trk system potassium transporter TrkA [Kiritimatiellaeota bacterium B1221]